MRPQDPNNPDEMLDIQGDLVARLEGDGQPPEDAHGTSKEVIHVQAPVSVPTTVVAWSVPAAYRGDDYLLNVAAGTLTGILRPFFTEEPGLLIDPETGKPAVECRVDGMPQASVIACYAEMKPRSLPDSIADRITDQVGQLWNPDMQTTLNNTYISGRFDAMAKDLHATEDFSDPKSGRAIQLAKHVHFSGSTTMAGDMIRSILEATSSEVSTFAVDFLDRKRSVKLYLEPNAAAAALSSLGAGGYAGDMLASKAASEPDPEEITPEAIRAVFHGPDLSNAVDRTLSNGLRVVVVPHGDSPLFSATLVAKGGKKTGDGGLDDFMEYNSTAIPHSDLWEGADADPIAIAGLWDNGRTSTYSQHTLKASAGNIDAVLWKLRRVVETRTTSPENKSRWANNTSDSVNSRWGSAVYWSDRLQTDRLAPGYDGFQYPDHNSIAAYKSLGSAEIKSYLDGKYQPGNSVLVIVGGMDPDAVMAEVEKRCGDWSARGGDAPAAPGPLAAPTGGGTFVLNTGGLQAVVDMSCQLPAWSAANAGAQQVAAGLLTEQLNERLLADGVVLYQGYSQAQQYAGGASLLQLYAVVDADSAGKTVNTLSELAAAMGKGEVDATRLGVAKRHLAQSYALRFQTLEQMRDAVVGLTTAPNMSLDFYDAYGDALAAVTPEAVGKELGSCTAHAVTAVRGDAAKIESSLSGAGVSYELFDWRAEGDAMLEAQDPKAYKKLLKDRAKGK
jgi:zinc protease